MTRRRQHVVGVALCVALSAADSPGFAQQNAADYAALALPPDLNRLTLPARWCATSYETLIAAQTGVRTAQTLADGRGLRATQVPRFLSPTHQGEFGFDNFVVLGDHSTVTFDRIDIEAPTGVTTEIWERTGTTTVAGRTASIFRPRWSGNELRRQLRQNLWGTDRLSIRWGDLVVSDPMMQPAFGQLDVGGRETISVWLNMLPPGLPTSPVTQIDETVQYSSDAVNLWIPEFGDTRVTEGDQGVDLQAVTRKFYEHFEDDVEIIVVATEEDHLASFPGFHQIVRNDIEGLGTPVLDSSASYGSDGVLLAVEFFSNELWTRRDTALHEIGHQWGEYSKVWDPLGATATRGPLLERRGHVPDVHTPLLSPGAVAYGAVLFGSRRVAETSGPLGAEFTIERTMPLVEFNPLTLYRMGHLAASDLPTYTVFADQGQFLTDTAAEPEVGTAVTGDHFVVTGDDIVAADGVRNGPVVTTLRRALVYVSRTGLLTPQQMSLVNYMAARSGAKEGITSWDRYPSFHEATGGRVEMTTTIHPRDVAAPTASLTPQTDPVPSPDVTFPPVGRRALVGVELDDPIPGRIQVGDTVTLNGRLTLTDRADYNQVCFRFLRYGAVDPNEVFVCGGLSGMRFSIPVSFTDQQQGTYTVENFAYWPDPPALPPHSWYGTIVVDDGPPAGP